MIYPRFVYQFSGQPLPVTTDLYICESTPCLEFLDRLVLEGAGIIFLRIVQGTTCGLTQCHPRRPDS